MFDSLNITKAYKLEANINGNIIEVATFNAVLNKHSNINIYMNINYPRLYDLHKEDILAAYREFNAEVTALAATMGLANSEVINEYSNLKTLEPVREEIKNIATNVFNDVIASLGNIQVNPVPTYELGLNEYMRY